MTRLLSGQVAVVTGGSSGIGQAIAHALILQEVKVVRTSRRIAPEQTRYRLDLPADLTDPAQVAALAEAARAAFGEPDLVVNSAGLFQLKPVEQTTPEDFAAHLAVNLQAVFNVARAFLPAMRARKSGRLITLGSIADHRAFPENAAYAASKYGVRGLHEVLRQEYQGTGVLCTLVSPGPTDTPVWDPIFPDRREGFVPRHQMLRAEDVADAVVWVAGLRPHIDVDLIRLGPA